MARLGVDIDMRRKKVATQLVKKLEKVILYYSPLLHDSWKGTFFSSDRSSYSDNGLLYIHPWRQPLFQIFTQSINAIDVTSVTLSRLNSINAIDILGIFWGYVEDILGIF